MTKIHPVAGYLLIEPQKQETVTASGIVLPTSNKEKPQRGKVLAIGASVFSDGREIVAPCQVGDTVFYKEWGANECKEGDDKFFLVKFDDIMAIIK